VKPGGGRGLPDGGSTLLSDVLAISRIVVDGGALHYEAPEKPPMRLRPLTFDLREDTRTASDADLGPGWYAFDVRLALDPVAQLDLDARLNLDTAVLDIASAVLSTSLTSAQYEIFTPELQSVLRQYAIVGDLEWQLNGQVPLRDTAGSAIDTHLSLSEASMNLGNYVLPLESVVISARLSEGVLDVHDATLESLGGKTQLTLRQWVAGSQAGRFELQGDGLDLDIEQALRYPKDVEPMVTGELDFHVRAEGSFADLAGTFAGSGDVLVDNGHFVFLDLMRNFLDIKGKRSERDRGSADFKLTPDRVRWNDVKMSGDLIGVGGSGDMYYDGRLEFLIASGPLHGRHGVVGLFGDLVTSVTSRLVAYRVSGTYHEPTIEVAPLEMGGVTKKKGE
jgi:hypothetical protein